MPTNSDSCGGHEKGPAASYSKKNVWPQWGCLDMVLVSKHHPSPSWPKFHFYFSTAAMVAVVGMAVSVVVAAMAEQVRSLGAGNEELHWTEQESCLDCKHFTPWGGGGQRQDGLL